jgi:hypothetical protein
MGFELMITKLEVNLGERTVGSSNNSQQTLEQR